MLAFLTTVRHPEDSVEYARVWQLLEYSLRSVLAQTDNDFRVVVVCNTALNDLPHLPGAASHLDLIDVALGPVGRGADDKETIMRVRADRGPKLVVALERAVALGADHVMFFDADDFLCRDVAAFVNTADKRVNGWYLDHGYRLNNGRIEPISRFWNRCGTAYIVRTAVLPPDLVAARNTRSMTREAIIERFGADIVTRWLGSHLYLGRELAARGTPLAAFPGRAAIKHLGTGENHSDFRAEPPSSRPTDDWDRISARQVRDFSLPPEVLDENDPLRDYAEALHLGTTRELPAWCHTFRLDRGARARQIERARAAVSEAHPDPEFPVRLHTDDGNSVLLSPMEHWIWEQCRGSLPLDELLLRGLQQFPERGAQLETEFDAILNAMVRKALVVLHDSRSDPNADQGR